MFSMAWRQPARCHKKRSRFRGSWRRSCGHQQPASSGAVGASAGLSFVYPAAQADFDGHARNGRGPRRAQAFQYQAGSEPRQDDSLCRRGEREAVCRSHSRGRHEILVNSHGACQARRALRKARMTGNPAKI